MPDYSNNKPVVVNAPVRFVIVGPGSPTPSVLLSSGEENSDLIGYYSLREAGLAEIYDNEQLASPSFILDLPFLGGRERTTRKGYYCVDVWEQDVQGPREKLYSLIYDAQYKFPSVERIVDTYGAKLSEQVRRAIKAAAENNREELIYVGQILSAFLSIIDERIQRRIERRRSLATMLSVVAFVYLVGLVWLFTFGRR
ncbi:MAG TPA: hypothetical protein VF744_20535 [Beijerinckiaceae bacterium]|jgi:hypothetical protein